MTGEIYCLLLALASEQIRRVDVWKLDASISEFRTGPLNLSSISITPP